MLNIDDYCIDNFIKDKSRLVKPNDKILDVGAGTSPYKHYFKHSFYESTDKTGNHTFLTDLNNHIPIPDETYDAILCTQVLEHVKYPQKLINELYRILKNNGKLFLTAPQGWMLHGEPEHYFNFTYYGLELLFNNAGFKIISIEPKGGVCWYLNDIIRIYPLPFKQLILYVLFHLDKLDKQQKFTIGYNCYCIKKVAI